MVMTPRIINHCKNTEVKRIRWPPACCLLAATASEGVGIDSQPAAGDDNLHRMSIKEDSRFLILFAWVREGGRFRIGQETVNVSDYVSTKY